MSYCPPGAAAITFVPADWKTWFPEFAAVPDASATGYFNRGTLLCANKIGPVPDTTTLTAYLYLLTAHICALSNPITSRGANPSSPPGALSSATEGSVSATFTNNYPPGSAQYYQQTKYGSEYWAATALYRTFQYRACIYPTLSLAQIPWLYPNTGS